MLLIIKIHWSFPHQLVYVMVTYSLKLRLCPWQWQIGDNNVYFNELFLWNTPVLKVVMPA